MKQAVYFKDWIRPNIELTRIGLVLILFAAMAQFASFGVIQAHVTSFYGVQSEDISFAFQIAFVGIISTLPIQFRTQRYFNIRNYLLIAFLSGILLDIGCMITHNLIIFMVLRFFIGVSTCIVAGCVLIILFTTLPEDKKMLVGVSIFFSLILTCGLIIGQGASWIVMRTDWTMFYYLLIGLQIISIVVCLSIFKPQTNIRPYPLFQIDWVGCLLFIFGAVSSAFVFIYGPKHYWMSDPVIRYAAVFSIFNFGLFLYRKATLKRPLIDLSVFYFGKFVFSLVLMLVFWGLKDSINLIYGYSASILGWSSTDIVNAGLFNITGVIVAILITSKTILKNKKTLPVFLIIGFIILCFYHLWFYYNLTPSLSFYQICFPIFLQGLACGFLFVPITIFCSASVPKSTGMTAIIVCAYARFFAGLNSISGLYTLQLYFNQKYKYGFLSKLTSESNLLEQRQSLYKGFLSIKGFGVQETSAITNMMVAKSTGVQSQLLTMRAMFMIAAIIAGAMVIILLSFAIMTKLKSSKINDFGKL